MKIFGVQVGKESAKKTPDILLAEASAFVGKGEYAIAVARFREALRGARPEDMPQVQSAFQGMWGAIETHAIRTMGSAGKEVSEFITEGEMAIDNLKLVQECANTFGLNGLFMDSESLARVVNDKVLKELEATLTPVVIGINKKKK